MTTTDTDALTECIARALWERNYPNIPWDTEGRRRGQDGFLDDARAVLPIVAEEVRKASEKAWDEGHNTRRTVEKGGWYLNPCRATGTGDSDEHR